MILNYHTLWRWVAEMRPAFEHARLIECFSQIKDVLHLAVVDTRRQAWSIEISSDVRLAHILMRPRHERRSRNSVTLFETTGHSRIVDADLAPHDRILRMRLEDGRCFYAELFGTINVYLTAPDGTIESAFKEPRQWIGHAYERITAFDPRPTAAFPDTVDDLKRWLSEGGLQLGKPLVMEWLNQLGSENDLSQARSDLTAFMDGLKTEKPRIYYVNRMPRLFSPRSMKHFREKEEAKGHTVDERLFDTINDALLVYVTEKSRADQREDVTAELVKACRTRIRKGSALLLALEQDRKKAESYAEQERRAHLLNIHLARVQRGMNRIEVPDIYAGDGSLITLDLDPELSPQENAARYFAQAKKLKASVRKIEERIKDLAKNQTQLETRLHELLDGRLDEKHLRGLYERFVREGWIRKAPARNRKPKEENEDMVFREYRVHGGWAVYVGQNDRKNDLLTFRFARKDDLWFHARGVPGSHVVLRRAGRKDHPGKLALEQTAGLAAWYSKARTSGLVPVSYTERKYVRKPKGAAPGQVLMEREEVMVVPPGEPPGGQLQIENQWDIV